MQDLTKANLDAWLTTEDIPVKVVMDSAGQNPTGEPVTLFLEMNIKDVNSSSVSIKAP